MAGSCSLTILLCLFVVCKVTLAEASVNANDIFDTGVCGTRPAVDPGRLRIYGGDDASSGQWPWIGSMQQGKLGHFCGCTLLNKEWAVTAAHCVVDSMNRINEMTITFGITNVKTLEPSEYRMTRSISGVIINPNSVNVGDVHNNDIALLHLSAPIEYTDHVRPACIQTDKNQADYHNCWVAGWGGLGTATDSDPEDEDYPDDLQHVQMPTITENECSRSDDDKWSDILSDDMLCAGANAGLSTCRGDSGGPLVCRDRNNLWNLVGVVSWGRGVCQDTDPSVFCRVPKFIDFIKTSALKYEDCGREIKLESSGSQNLTSHGFPSNYDEYTYCFWTITAQTGQRVYATFQQFNLQRVDFLHVGVNQHSPRILKYAGDVLPPDLVSPNETMYISFESDAGRTDVGFHIVFSSTERTDFQTCANSIEIVTSDKRCDGFPDCYDLSDEQCDTVDTQDVFDTGICGTRQHPPWTRIHGGTSVSDTSSWPWIGSIQLFYRHICACTLLNDKWVVTSASCVIGLGDDLKYVKVSLGQADVSPWLDSEHQVLRKIVNSIFNPEREHIFADLDLLTNDLALLELDHPVEFNSYIRPICLAAHQDETKEYLNCKVAGWGDTNAYYSDHTDLNEVSVPLISPETCRDRYEIGNLVSTDMICAGGPSRGICPGDLGAPLICEDSEGFFYLVGVASLGIACSSDNTDPGIYSRISWQLPFLIFGVNTGEIPCRSDQFRCNDGQCLPSRWAKCNVTSECQDGSDEHGCDYCPEKEITLSLNSTMRLQSVGYPYGYDNDVCTWTVTPAPNRKVMVQIIDMEFDYSTNLYVGNKADPRLLRFSGIGIPKLQLLSKVDEAIYFEFSPNSYIIAADSKGFSVVFSDSNDQDAKHCPNGLEVYDRQEYASECQGKKPPANNDDHGDGDHHDYGDGDHHDHGDGDHGDNNNDPSDGVLGGDGAIGGIIGGISFFVLIIAGVVRLVVRYRSTIIPSRRLENVFI